MGYGKALLYCHSTTEAPLRRAFWTSGGARQTPKKKSSSPDTSGSFMKDFSKPLRKAYPRRQSPSWWTRSTRAGGRDRVGVIILGRGEDENRIHDWLTIGPQTEGIIGFDVGHTVFWKPLVDYKDGAISRPEAASRIAGTYQVLYKLFIDARARFSPSGTGAVGMHW